MTLDIIGTTSNTVAGFLLSGSLIGITKRVPQRQETTIPKGNPSPATGFHLQHQKQLDFDTTNQIDELPRPRRTLLESSETNRSIHTPPRATCVKLSEITLSTRAAHALCFRPSNFVAKVSGGRYFSSGGWCHPHAPSKLVFQRNTPQLLCSSEKFFKNFPFQGKIQNLALIPCNRR